MHKLIQVTEQTLWQIVGRIVISLSAFLALALITRNYGKDAVGVYTLAQTYLTMFFIIGDLGLNAYVLARLKESPSEANKLFSIRFYWSVLLVVLAMLLALVLPLGDGLFKKAVLLGLFSILGSGIFTSVNLIFQERFKYQVSIIASSVGSVVMFLATIFLVISDVPPYMLLISYSLAWMANNIASLLLVNKYYHFKLLKPDFGYFFNLVKKVWPVSTTLILNVIYFRFDTFILAASRGLSEVAIYNLSYTLFQTALFLPTFIMNSYYPIILTEISNKKLLFRQLKIAFMVMVVLASLGTLIAFVASPSIIRLVTGGGFEESIAVINILSLSFPAFFTTALLMWVYVSLKRYKALMWIYLIGLIVNIMLNLIFTPTYSYIATSWITVFSEYLILTLQLIILLL